MRLSNVKLIQGGMGIYGSPSGLANLVARTDPRAMGVVSGTAIDNVMVAKLQLGDPSGDVRRALAAFPYPEVSKRITTKYFIDGGKEADRPFRRAPMVTADPSVEVQQLLVAANFVEVWLAKEGHDGFVGINHLTKITMPLLPSLYGALLAGVDCVIMGAGIPTAVPAVLDLLSEHKDATYKFDVKGAPRDSEYALHFSPKTILGDRNIQLQRPDFFPIVASNALFTKFAKNSIPPVEGVIFEWYTAGGHNAGPRGRVVEHDKRGQPIYGKKDDVDFDAVVARQQKVFEEREGLKVPFWLAGGRGSPEGLQEALALGAVGIQVGTAFALSQESGFDPALRARALDMVLQGGLDVHKNARISPTDYPFNMGEIPGTLSEAAIYAARDRICDLSYLVVPYLKADGTLGYRCASEPVDKYLKKGGTIEETVGRGCLCNALFAAVAEGGSSLGQIRKKGTVPEPPVMTLGDKVMDVKQFFPSDESSVYSAADVVKTILGSSN